MARHSRPSVGSSQTLRYPPHVQLNVHTWMLLSELNTAPRSLTTAMINRTLPNIFNLPAVHVLELLFDHHPKIRSLFRLRHETRIQTPTLDGTAQKSRAKTLSQIAQRPLQRAPRRRARSLAHAPSNRTLNPTRPTSLPQILACQIHGLGTMSCVLEGAAVQVPAPKVADLAKFISYPSPSAVVLAEPDGIANYARRYASDVLRTGVLPLPIFVMLMMTCCPRIELFGS
ncbi:hypothetical protein BC628DRAFT_38745 [Trametes gibbosa]|nr:hypothetical protein BC628DRAFT_38745 [Trametes gibbosa]